MAAKHCPNCGGKNTEQLPGDRLLCIDCNVTYKIEVDGSAKPVDTDPLGKIVDRVRAKIKSEQSTPAAPGQPSTPADLQPEEQSEEDDGI